MDRPDDLLEAAQPALALRAEEAESATGVDRREFLFMSMVAAAATTFGSHVVRAQGRGAGAGVTPGAAAPQQPVSPPFPLGNGEPPAEQFMPYPGGTGALMEKMVKQHGAKAFHRSAFTVEKWRGTVPDSDEAIAFLPAHRLSALIKAKKLTSVRLTTIYLERLKRLNPVLLCAVTIMEAQALAEAARCDAEMASGTYRGPLHGIPYGVKDLFNTKGVPTTWGTADFEHRIIDDDADVVVRLRNAIASSESGTVPLHFSTVNADR